MTYQRRITPDTQEATGSLLCKERQALPGVDLLMRNAPFEERTLAYRQAR